MKNIPRSLSSAYPCAALWLHSLTLWSPRDINFKGRRGFFLFISIIFAETSPAMNRPETINKIEKKFILLGDREAYESPDFCPFAEFLYSAVHQILHFLRRVLYKRLF